MDELYDVIRTINFIWGFILFCFLIYWGIQDVAINRRCDHVHVPPEFQIWAFTAFLAVLVLVYSTGEILFQELPGGPRVLLPWTFLSSATYALKLGAFRVRMHRRSVELGICSQENPHEHL